MEQILDTTHTVLLTQRQALDKQHHTMAVPVEHHPMTVTTTVIHTALTARIPQLKMDTCTICGDIGLVAR